jgi:hypothetical protein
MDFTFKHPESNEVKTVSLSPEKIQEMIGDQIAEELICDCQPIGETNVVECNCEDYLCEFELQERTD